MDKWLDTGFSFELANHFEIEVVSFDLRNPEALVKLKLLFLNSESFVYRTCGLRLRILDLSSARSVLDKFFATTNRGFCKLFQYRHCNRTLFYCDLYDATNRNINQYLINNNLAEDYVEVVEEELAL